MPSPFPGMDPYFEDPFTWPSVHANLIAQIGTLLNTGLRPRYVARIEQRVYVSDKRDAGRRFLVPDVALMGQRRRAASSSAASSGTTAVAEFVEMRTVLEELEIRERYLTLRSVGNQRIITVIEVLSPANKTKGSQGYENFEEKRDEILSSSTHWVEIDLLREGESTIDRSCLDSADYLMHVSRSDKRPTGKVWPIALDRSLPKIDIPLQGDDPAFTLDLQDVFNKVYENGSFDLTADYSKPPSPPLPPRYAEWAERLRQEKGFR